MKKIKLFMLLFSATGMLQTKAQSPCLATGALYTANYASGWSLFDLGDGNASTSTACGDLRNGTIASSGTQASFVTARDSRELRLTSAIPTPSNTSWTMDFRLTINNPPAGGLANNSPSVILAALTAQAMNIVSGCVTPAGGDFCTSCGTYPNTNMDGIWVALTANPPSSCASGAAGWRFNAYARDGGAAPLVSSSINIPVGLGTYYIRLQRSSTSGGVLSVFSDANYSVHLVGSPTCYTIPGSVTNLGFLSHEVHSQGSCYRVFNGTVANLKIDNGITCPLSLTPSFTMPSSICQGTLISVNGSASSGSPMGIANYVWTVVESNSAGVPATGATEWWSPWGTGNPGAYTIPSVGSGGPNIQCGKYYKVKLAIGNCGNPWAETSKVIFVNCPPGLDLGPDQTICAGDCILLNPGRPVSGFSYLWSEGSTTSSIAVCPPVTTTYCVTKTDLATGCTATDCITINVANNNSSFSLFVNTAPTTHFTVSLTANDLSGFSQPGFTYSLNISELDGLGNPYYSDGGINCWWNYPGAETFQGYVSTGTGTFTQSPWWPATCPGAGQFLYGHTYKITRATWNNYCPAVQSYIIITPVRSSEGYTIVSTNDPQTPSSTLTAINSRLTQSMSKDDGVAVYPNPSNGVFSVELKNASAGTIEVFDAFGKNVQTINVLEGVSNYNLDLSKYAKGIYMLNVVSNGNKASQKIIIE